MAERTEREDEVPATEESPPNPAVVVMNVNGNAQVAAMNGLDPLAIPTLLKMGLKQINKSLDIE